MKYSSCVYRIDESDRISYVSPTWLMFAEHNDAPELSKDDVIGRSIWDFVIGDPIRRIYRELFRQVRSGDRAIMMPFRCDSPTRIRHMELTIRPAPEAGIQFESRLMLSLDREEVPLFDANAERSNECVDVCSFCRKFQLEDGWMTAGDAVAHRSWFNGNPVPRLTETLCGDCLNRLHEDLGVS